MSSTFRSKPLPLGVIERAPGDFGRARKPAPVNPLEAHLGFWLRVVSNHVSYSFKEKVERHGVTVAEWVVLRALYDEDGIQPSALSERLGLTRGTISKLLDRLIAKALVLSRAHAEDRRARVVTLSAQGRGLVPKLAALADQNDAEAFGHLKAAERATLQSLLEALASRHALRSAPVD